MTTARSRSPRLPGAAVLVLALILLGTSYAFLAALLAPRSSAAEPAENSLAVREGRALYLVGCSSCHGLEGQGSSNGPSLIGSGAAAVDFQVGTGRMPLVAQGPQAERKPPKYSQPEIDQLAAYVASLGPGPEIPTVNLEEGDIAEGGELFRTNCASCHNFAGQGGALTYGKYAPALAPATPVHIAEAMRTGPESMPVYGPAQLTDEEVNSIVKYVQYVTNEHTDPGGNGIGRLGPVPEGIVAWVIGIGAAVAFTLWIGGRA